MLLKQLYGTSLRVLFRLGSAVQQFSTLASIGRGGFERQAKPLTAAEMEEYLTISKAFLAMLAGLIGTLLLLMLLPTLLVHIVGSGTLYCEGMDMVV